MKHRTKEPSIENQLDTTTTNEEESANTDRNRSTTVSHPSVSAIQNRKQLPSLSSNNNRPSLANVGRSKTSPDNFNSNNKQQAKHKDHNESNVEENHDLVAKIDLHAKTEGQSNKSEDKDLNNNSEIIYNIETVLKHLENEYYLRYYFPCAATFSSQLSFCKKIKNVFNLKSYSS